MTEPRRFRVPLDLSEVEAAPIGWANYFVLQHTAGEFVLSVAQLRPPVLVGEDEEKERHLRELESLPVRVLAKVAVSRKTLLALIGLITSHIERFPEGQAIEEEISDA